MRILFVGSRRQLQYPQYGWLHTRELLDELQRRGHHVGLLDGPLPPYAGSGRCQRKRYQSCWTTLNSLPGALKLAARFAGRLRFTLWALGHACARTGEFDVVYGRHGLLPVEWLVGRSLRIPVVKEVNGLVAVEASMGPNAVGGWAERVMWRVEHFSLSRADWFVAVTPELGRHLVSRCRVDSSRVAVIGNGANVEHFVPRPHLAAREALGLEPSRFYVLFVGALQVWTRLEHLIACAPHVVAEEPRTRFLIVGDGVERARFETLVAQQGMSDHVLFVGQVPYDWVPWYCSCADVCVVCPRIDDEPARGASPLKLHEYLAAGRPVVASRLMSFRFIEREGLGSLVDPNDGLEFARAILDLLHNQTTRDAMGRRARDYVIANASWAYVSERVGQVLEKAVFARSG